MRPAVLTVALALGLGVSACDAAVPSSTTHDVAAAFRPDLIVADRASVAPGDVVQLTFPTEMVRGLHFVLEEEVGESWVYRYGLMSSAEGSGPGGWFVPGDEDATIPDIGIAGPGPDRVPIPDAATPGSWRICTGNARQNVCVRIEVVAR